MRVGVRLQHVTPHATAPAGGSLRRCRVSQAGSGNPDVASTGVIETANLYTAGEFEVVAKFPPVNGVVSSVWLFHFEVPHPEPPLPP